MTVPDGRAWVVVGLLGVAGTLGFTLANRAATADARVTFEQAVGAHAAELAQTASVAVATVERLATASNAGFAAAADDARRSTAIIALARVEAGSGEVAAVIPVHHGGAVDAVLHDPGVADLFGIARDRGTPAVGAAVVDPATAGRQPVIVMAQFGDAAPGTSQARRASLVGHIVALLEPEQLLPQSLPIGVRSLTISDASAILAQAGDGGGGDLQPGPGQAAVGDAGMQGTADGPAIYDISVGGTTWRLFALPEATGPAALAWVVLVGFLLATFMVIFTDQARGRRQLGVLEAMDERMKGLELAADMGPILQESLDLGDVVPAAVIRMVDVLGLDGVAVLVADDRGVLNELFRHGRLPQGPRTVAEMALAPTEADAGEVVTLPLLRGGRIGGALRLLPGRAITEDRMRALRAVADLLGSAVANAATFNREQDAVKRFRELDALKTDFMGTVSHELRTPVTAIAGFGAMLQSNWDQLEEPSKRDAVERIVANAMSLHVLVEELLDFARLEGGGGAAELALLDLGEVATRIIRDMAPVIDQHEVRVNTGADVIVLADLRALERVISNLLSNAAKYAPTGSVIEVTIGRVDDAAVLWVDDEGAGIQDDERERVFSRFYRGEHELARRTRGVGIGLAVVRELCQLMGGDATVLTGPSGGARLEVRLPLAEPAVLPLPTGDAIAERSRID